MASIVTSKFRVHNAQQFVESFSEASNTTMYLFVGKNTAFPDDNNPPTPVNSTANIEFTPWRDMYGAKRIQSTDVTHAIERYNWTSGTVYDAYDDQDTNLLDDDFYAGSNFVYSDASKIETFGKVVSLGESKNTLEANKPDGGCGYSIRCILSITSDLRDYNVNVLSGNQLTGIKDLNQNKKEPEGGLAPEFTEEEFQGEEEKN